MAFLWGHPVERKKCGLGMNVKKTNTMVVSKQDGDNIKAHIKFKTKP